MYEIAQKILMAQMSIPLLVPSEKSLSRSFFPYMEMHVSTELRQAYVDYAQSVIESKTSEPQTMTSLQIADITGKQHAHVMEAIRTMEPVWQKVSQSKFRLASYVDRQGKERPCYELTKTECLYIATKFNDEARARLILRWEQLETEHCAPTDNNPQLQFVQTQVYLAETISRNLRLNEASRLGMYQSIAEPYRLAIPQYVESKGVTKSLKDLLADMHSPYSAIKFNQMLEAQGYVETKSRPTSGGKAKRFKSITDKGLAYGENLQSPKNQKETQPHWYADRFGELYRVVTA